MSKNFIEAALLQLKGQGVAHLAAIETMVSSPAGVADHTTHVDDIMKHARGAAECDEAVRILQRYFAAKPAPAPQPMPPMPPMPVAPASPGGAVPAVTSPTMRRAMQVKKMQEESAARLKAEAAVAKPKATPKRRTRKKKEE
tara:strand:- start:176 stop:601 length:426 start_codon:yes stop_codon:yes gene_type:complete